MTGPRPLSIPNPFSNAAVGSVWEDGTVDVPAIHGEISAQLMQRIEERARGHHHRAVMLFGDAGAGKTHVLRRLRMSLERDSPRVVPFSWVRMQTSPSMMWRLVRRTMASDLTARPFRGGSQLGEVLADSRGKIDEVRNRDLAVVLEHLAAGNHRRDARAWLAGNTLPESALEAMALATPDSDEESAEEESRQIVFALASFIAPAPVVLCLDQLEALQSYPGDKTGLFAIGKLMAAIHDEAPNVVAIGCVQVGLVAELAANLSRAEQDRYQPMGLSPLKMPEVRALVKARLDTNPGIARLRPPRAAEFWPVDLARLEPLVSAPEGVSARKVIFECEQMFRAAQNIAMDATPLADRLSGKYHERTAAAERELTSDTSASVLSDALPRLLHIRGAQARRDGVPRWVDHAWTPPGGREIAVVLANESARALWRKLERVSREWNPAERDIVIVRDTLNPLRATAMRSQALLADLRKRGARFVNPSREALIALDAARRLLADVESGDLTHRGEKIAVATVEEWVRANLPGAARRLMEDVAGERLGDCGLARMELAAYLADKKVAAVRQACLDLRMTRAQVEECANRNPDQFGFLAGAEPVVFEKVGA